jgi:hypothetical protein
MYYEEYSKRQDGKSIRDEKITHSLVSLIYSPII